MGGIGVATTLGILRPAPEPLEHSRSNTPKSSVHYKKRSVYEEYEVRSSDASVESDDRASARLDNLSNLNE